MPKLTDENRGALIISGHGGPAYVQSFLFTEIFNKPLGSYSAQPISKSERRFNQVVIKAPNYIKGQERSLLKGVIRGEWINILNDCPLSPTHASNCNLAGCHVALPTFSFQLSLRYKIPLLFVEIVYKKEGLGIIVRIKALEGFSNSTEGLSLYTNYLEKVFVEDPYANAFVPTWILKQNRRN